MTTLPQLLPVLVFRQVESNIAAQKYCDSSKPHFIQLVQKNFKINPRSII